MNIRICHSTQKTQKRTDLHRLNSGCAMSAWKIKSVFLCELLCHLCAMANADIHIILNF